MLKNRIFKIIFFTPLIIAMQLCHAGPFDTPVAMITFFDGKVNFENSTDREVDFGTDIFIGDILKTGKEASLLLTFYDGCRQEVVDQKSIIQVSKNHSVLRSGQFTKISTLNCKVPKASLQEKDSHLKAGLVIRGVNNASMGKTITNTVKVISLSPNNIIPLINKNSFHLKAWTNHGRQSTVDVKLNEPILIHFLASQDAYVNISYFSSEGERYQLTPALHLEQGKMVANKLYTIGNEGIELYASLPVGLDMIHIITSNNPILLENNDETKTKNYYEKLAIFIKKNPQQSYSERQIKLKIIQ